MKRLRFVLPLALGGFILFWVYRDFDFSMLGAILLRGMHWGWMLLSLAFGVLSHVIRGWRWKQALKPMGAFPKTSNCINAVFVSYAANLMIPRLGEISRCGILANYEKVPFAKSLGTVVTERLIDGLCLVVITIITLLVQVSVFNHFFTKTGIDVSTIFNKFTSVHFYIILCCVVATVVLLHYLIRTLSFFKKVKGMMLNVREGVMSLRKVTNLPLFILLTVLIWFCYFMHFYIAFFCFSFTGHLGIWAGVVMFIGGTFSVVVPTPAGAGPWHFVIISMMSLYDVSVTDAGIFALLVHSVQTFLIVLLGIYGMAMLPVMNKSKNL
ncbi:hypothetical protein EZS27_002025 [termite gut metagenome]|uniref:Dolichol-P-glucose synthetase n=1 Tax=termite gut metagenome TaxID=433724 RepID=A0A5J4SXP7_9ZZZZ